jgi:hypothetical protein
VCSPLLAILGVRHCATEDIHSASDGNTRGC